MNTLYNPAPQLEFLHLAFKPSDKAGKFTAKVKTYKEQDGKSVYSGDAIVISDGGGGVKWKGKWDVKVRPMKKGTGYLVVSAAYTQDVLSIWHEGWVVRVRINGKEDRLIKRNGDTVPLTFSCPKFFAPEKICDYVQEKADYLQLPENFDMEQFLNDFVFKCYAVYEDYKKSVSDGR